MTNSKLFSIGCVLILISGMFSSCYYDSEEFLYGTVSCDTTAQVIYTLDIVPLLEANCYTCHNNANASVSGGDISLEGYANVLLSIVPGDAGASKLYNSVAWTPGVSQMPKGGAQLSDCDVLKIKKWINDGAVNS